MSDVETRALACKGWRWMGGMRVLLDGHRAVNIAVIDAAGVVAVAEATRRSVAYTWPDWRLAVGVGWPDFEDPATLGCLRALACEAFRANVYVMAPTAREPMWCAYRQGPPSEHLHAVEAIIVGRGVNHAEALVAALEHAERRGH